MTKKNSAPKLRHRYEHPDLYDENEFFLTTAIESSNAFVNSNALPFQNKTNTDEYQPSGNPYAYIDPDFEEDYARWLSIAQSKIKFENFLRHILIQYCPTVGKMRRLTYEFRVFIKNNSSKSIRSRLKILRHMLDYDLGLDGFDGAIFHRELSNNLGDLLQKITDEF